MRGEGRAMYVLLARSAKEGGEPPEQLVDVVFTQQQCVKADICTVVTWEELKASQACKGH